MREEICQACQGEGIIYLGHGIECLDCNGVGFISIPSRRITVRELPSPHGGTYAVASCGAITATGAWAGEAIDELMEHLK